MRAMMLKLEKELFLLEWRWLTTGLVFLICYYVARFYNKVSKYPKGPFPLPIVGNLLTFISKKRLYKKAQEWSYQYGDPFTLWLGEKPMVILNSNQVVRQAFVEKRHQFSGRFPTKFGSLRAGRDHGVLFEDYTPVRKALRKVMLTALRKYVHSESFEGMCCDVVDAYVNTLAEGPQLVDSRDPLVFIIFNIMSTSVYGTRLEPDSPEMQMLHSVNKAFHEEVPNGLPSDIAPWLSLFYRSQEVKMENHFHKFLVTLDKLYQKTKRDYVPGTVTNFTHAMLAAKDEAIQEEKGDAQYLTEGNLIQILLDIFGAGTDTTVGELQWLLLRMTKEPLIQAKVQKEIEDNIGRAPPTMKDREKLPYTVACLMEALRFYPIVPLGLPHNTTSDTEAGGCKIPKDTGILYNIYNINHDGTIWKDPDVFRPERFLDPITGRLRQDVPSMMSFGLGPRSCPGEKFAHANMFIILVRLMQRLSVSSPTTGGDVKITTRDSNLFLVPMTQSIVFTRRLQVATIE